MKLRVIAMALWAGSVLVGQEEARLHFTPLRASMDMSGSSRAPNISPKPVYLASCAFLLPRWDLTMLCHGWALLCPSLCSRAAFLSLGQHSS